MLPRRLRRTSAALCLALAALAGPLAAQDAVPADRPPLLLMGTIPIYWGEADGLGELLNGGSTPHWARTVLERRFSLVPLDTLSAETLPPGGGLLLLAQPRTLSAAENVALDAWVRGGGRLLLLADPALTQHSDFAITDPRRPQAVSLLSPILTRWGLELTFDESQPFGAGTQPGPEAALPYNLAGRWRIAGPPAGGGQCRALADALVVICTVGAGRVVAVADAAVLEPIDPAGERRAALAWLLDALARDR